jgi:hypothetical protein
MNCSYSSCKEKEGPLQTGICNCTDSYHKECLYNFLDGKKHIENGDRCPKCNIKYRIEMNNISFLKEVISRCFNLYFLFYSLYTSIYINAIVTYFSGRSIKNPFFLFWVHFGWIGVVLGFSGMVWVEYEGVKDTIEIIISKIKNAKNYINMNINSKDCFDFYVFCLFIYTLSYTVFILIYIEHDCLSTDPLLSLFHWGWIVPTVGWSIVYWIEYEDINRNIKRAIFQIKVESLKPNPINHNQTNQTNSKSLKVE